MIRVILILGSVCAAAGASCLFEDLFDDGNAEGWTEYNTFPDSAHYTVDGWYHMEIQYLDASVSAFSGDDDTTTPWCMSIPDYTFYCKSKAWSPTSHVGFAVRMESSLSSEQGYMAWLRYTMNDVVLWRHDAPGSYVQLAWHPWTLEHGEEYWIRLDAWGGSLKVKVWQGTFWDEPSGYIIEAYDNTYQDPGSMGMGCHSWGTVQNHAAFDSVMVCDPLSLEMNTWAGIKTLF